MLNLTRHDGEAICCAEVEQVLAAGEVDTGYGHGNRGARVEEPGNLVQQDFKLFSANLHFTQAELGDCGVGASHHLEFLDLGAPCLEEVQRLEDVMARAQALQAIERRRRCLVDDNLWLAPFSDRRIFETLLLLKPTAFREDQHFDGTVANLDGARVFLAIARL